MLNILYATTSTSLSGGTRQLINNAIGMAEAGHKITVCCFPEASLIQELAGIENITVSIIDQDSLWGRLSFFRNLLVTRSIHVVHCFHNKFYKYFLFLRFMCPQFKLFLNRGVIFAPGSFPLLYLPQLTGIICNSRAAAKVLEKYRIPSNKIHVVYNAILPPKKPLKKPEEHLLTLTYIGNKQPYKGLDVFLKTVVELGNFNLPAMRIVIAGVNAKAQFKEFLGSDLLNKIDFRGGISHKEIFILLQQTDIFIITSRQESLPNTLLEAYAAGTAVVATNVGGIGEVLSPGVNGYLCASEDVPAIARAIVSLAKDPHTRKKLAETNRAYHHKSFSLAAKISNLLTIYQH